MAEPQFLAPARSYAAGELAVAIEAPLADPAHAAIMLHGVAPIADAKQGLLSFADGKKHVSQLAGTRASAVICRAEAASSVPAGVAVLVAQRPQESFARATALFFPAAMRPGTVTGETGVSPAAHVSPLAELEDGVIVEAGAIIGAGAAIGTGTVVAAHAVIGPHCQIGRNCHIGIGATVQFALVGNRVIIHPGARIGQDGFGYVQGSNTKIPQIGRVVLQDDVEVGANSTIDRGALGDTVVGERTKIDNLVQIGHNVRIGRGCVIVAQCGISGSVTIGDYVSMGGQVGTTSHISVGERAMIAGRAGLISDVPAGEVWFGFPARPRGEALREIATLKALARSRKNTHD